MLLYSNYACGYYIGMMVDLIIQGVCLERTVKRTKDLGTGPKETAFVHGA